MRSKNFAVTLPSTSANLAATIFSSSYKVTFVIFLYDISRNRLGKDMHTHMSLLNESRANIIPLTTFWDRLANDQEGVAREKYLKSRYKIFQKAGQHLGRDVQDKSKPPHPSFLDPVSVASNLFEFGPPHMGSIEPSPSIDPEKFPVASSSLTSLSQGQQVDRGLTEARNRTFRRLVMSLCSCCSAHCISQ